MLYIVLRDEVVELWLYWRRDLTECFSSIGDFHTCQYLLVGALSASRVEALNYMCRLSLSGIHTS